MQSEAEMKHKRKNALAAITLSILAQPIFAQAFPNKPVTIVVPFSAGGPTDKVARDLAVAMGKDLGQPVIVDNSVGAGGIIGTRKVATARKDGYTILVHTMGISTAPSLYKKLGYDPLTDLEYIGQIVDVPMVILGSKNFAPKDFAAAQKYIHDHPGQVTIGHAGPGSAAHLCTLLFERELGVPLASIAYKGSAPALSDVLGGQIDMVCDQTTSLIGHLKSESLKPYAITTSERVSPFDQLPTASEQGLPNFDVKTWHGMYVPKGTPPEVLQRLGASLQAVIQDPAFQKKMQDMGAQVVSVDDATPASLQTKLTSETKRWAAVISDAGIQPN